MRNVLYLFGQLGDDDVSWMARAGRARTLGDGATMIEAGDELEAVFVLLDGQLSVRVGGREVAHLQPGEIVGEMSLVDARPASATVAARGDVRVLEIGRPALEAQLRRDQGFAARFYRGVAVALSDRLRGLQARDGGDADAGDELNPELLDTMHLAGERFQQLLRAVR